MPRSTPLDAALRAGVPLDYLSVHEHAAAAARSDWSPEDVLARATKLGWETGPLASLEASPEAAMRAGVSPWALVGWLRDVLTVVARQMREATGLTPSPPALSGCTLIGRWHSGEDVPVEAFHEVVGAEWATDSDIDDPVWFSYDAMVVQALRAIVWITQLEELEAANPDRDGAYLDAFVAAASLVVGAAEQGAEIVAVLACRGGTPLEAASARGDPSPSRTSARGVCSRRSSRRGRFKRSSFLRGEPVASPQPSSGPHRRGEPLRGGVRGSPSAGRVGDQEGARGP